MSLMMAREEPWPPYGVANFASLNSPDGVLAKDRSRTHLPNGTLSHSWPRRMAQILINVGDPGYGPLFPRGYGLTY